jgi:hypothetical protein
MKKQTRISVRRFFLLVTYLSILIFLVTRRPDDTCYFAPLTWVFHFAQEAYGDGHALPYCVAGCLLLVGTIPPYLLTRWWTLLTAVVCGVLYLLIGMAGAANRFAL